MRLCRILKVKMGHSSQSNFSSLLAIIVLVEQKPMLSKKKLFSAIKKKTEGNLLFVISSQFVLGLPK